MNNVVLIGMPGVGKSTLGVLLAKASGRDFLDTDVYLQARCGRSLQDIISGDGPAGFQRLEEEAVLALKCANTVIATGGSVAYSVPAMARLQSGGRVVFLTLPLDRLRARLDDFEARGVVRQPQQSLESLFAERQPLYQRYADIVVDCTGKNHEQVVVEILQRLRAL